MRYRTKNRQILSLSSSLIILIFGKSPSQRFCSLTESWVPSLPPPSHWQRPPLAGKNIIIIILIISIIIITLLTSLISLSISITLSKHSVGWKRNRVILYPYLFSISDLRKSISYNWDWQTLLEKVVNVLSRDIDTSPEFIIAETPPLSDNWIVNSNHLSCILISFILYYSTDILILHIVNIHQFTCP